MFNKNGKYQKALSLLLLFIVICIVPLAPLSGKNVRFYNDKGWSHFKKGEYYKASLNFKNALSKNPRFLDSILGLAKTYYKMTLYDRSIELYRSAVQMDRKSWKAQIGMGLNLSAMGRYKAAFRHFDLAEKLSGGNTEVHYAIAALYYNMGKEVWSKRRLQSVLRANRFHYEGLLLFARISSNEKRYKRAEEFIDRAISANSEAPDAYVLKGEIRLKRSIEDGEVDYPGVLDACKQALSIQPQHYKANVITGMMYYLKGDYKASNDAYTTAFKTSKKTDILYNIAVTSDLNNMKDEALKYFLLALKNHPLDSILLTRLQHFLVINNYKIGHPARIMMSKESYELAQRRMKQHLSGQGIHYLRKTILMNPINVKAREELMSYYEVKGYNRFYIEDLKELSRIKGGRKYRDRLTAAIIDRRKQLYHKEALSVERPVRDVPSVLVLDFTTKQTLTPHADGGSVIGDAFSFSLNQFGRMATQGIKSRKEYIDVIKKSKGKLENIIEILSLEIKKGNLKPIDYIVLGTYEEHSDLITLRFSLMNFHQGVIISSYYLRDSGREALARLSLRGARRVYNTIPFKGRILKVKEKDVILNLGSYDGIEKGQKLVIYKYNISSKKGQRYAILLEVKETNTLISRAVPRLIKDLDLIDPRDRVFPLKQRRAKRIK